MVKGGSIESPNQLKHCQIHVRRFPGFYYVIIKPAQGRFLPRRYPRLQPPGL